MKKVRKTLEDRTLQFRTIQKRLLNRFKDKNPSALNNLDFLLNHTYGQIVEASTMVEGLKDNIGIAGSYLSNAIEICCLCLSLQCRMSDAQYDALRNYLTSWVDEGNLQSDLGWEEIVQQSTAHLLRTSLSRKQGQTNMVNTNTRIEPLENVEKLRKQIAAVFERIKAGSVLDE